MTYLATLLILIGIYLIDSGVKNRAPIGFLMAVARDPSDLRKTLDQFNGNWTPGIGEVPRGTSGRVPKPSGQGLPPNADPRNGRLKASELKALTWAPGQRLAPGAADALTSLNKAYRARFGRNLTVTDSYRSYAAQVATKALKGDLAADPGTSNHGVGLAVDLGGGVEDFGTPQHEWMQANASKYGWVHPSWARQGGSKPEPWHWEFVGNTVAA